MARFHVNWDDVPPATLDNLEAGRRIGVTQLACWVVEKRPCGLDGEATSNTVLGILARFNGAACREKLLAIRNWPSYLREVSWNAARREQEQDPAQDAGDARLDKAVDPRIGPAARAEIRDLLTAIPRTSKDLTPGERKALRVLIDDVMGALARHKEARVMGHAAASARHRARAKLGRLLLDDGGSTPRTPRLRRRKGSG